MAVTDHQAQKRRPGVRLAKAAAVFSLLGVMALSALLGYFAYELPLASNLETPAARSFRLKSANDELFAYRGVHQGEAQSYEALPTDFVNAVLAIEDRRFFSHTGIDWRGIARAVWTNLRAGGVRQGGSTLTQQYVKLAYLTRDRSLRRKIQEAILAVWLESRLEKQEIFRRYVNLAYFGAGAYGVDAAARRYFGKAVGDLTLAESAMLAGLIRAPSQLAPTHNLAAAQARAELVLKAMIDSGFVTSGQAAKAIAQPAELKATTKTRSSDAYFADWVQRQAAGKLESVYGDFELRTTLRPELQAIAESLITETLERDGEALNASQAALVAMTFDGAVVAMIGGRDYRTSQFNRATQAQRQPGSLFKLFVFQAALEAGFSPDSRMLDKPVTVEGWSPKNYSKRYLGSVTLREAFAKSLNTVTVQLSEKLGRKQVIETAKRLGITSPIQSHPSFALGTSSVNLLEITAAYGAVAGGKQRLVPYGIEEVSAGGAPLLRHQAVAPTGSRDGNRKASAEMIDLLVAAIRTGTGRGARIGELAGGKTGTSQDHRDAWFVGFSDDLVVGVWTGNDDNQPMKAVTGGGLPAKIWHDFMQRSRKVRKKIPASLEIAQQPNSNARPSDAPPVREESKTPAPSVAKSTSTSETAKAKPKKAQRQMPEVLRGVPRVIDTATLRFGRKNIRLVGVATGGDSFVSSMESYIGGRRVTCQPFNARFHSCEVGGFDLSEVVIFNGGALATRNAPAYLREAEAKAREGRRGIWAR